MTVRDIGALMRRHLLAVSVVLVIAVGAVYDIRSSPAPYSESATVVFTVPNWMAGTNSSGSFTPSLVTTEVMMTQTLMSPSGLAQVRAAGGIASWQLVPLNQYSQQYPDYAEPGALLTTVSPRPADARRTFTVVLRTIGQRLAAMQAGVPARRRIEALVVADTGAIAAPGSSTRMLAGLTLLTVVAVFMVANFLDRRRRRPGGMRPAGHRRRLAAG